MAAGHEPRALHWLHARRPRMTREGSSVVGPGSRRVAGRAAAPRVVWLGVKGLR